MSPGCSILHERSSKPVAPPAAEASAVLHGLFWMMTANLVGVWLALILLFPGLNRGLGEWTYGRWMPLHLNLHLYGWTSLPLLALLFRLYRVGETKAGRYARGTVWLWSMALVVGAASWLGGESGGKIFLEWSGFSRGLLAVAMGLLWCVLAWAWIGTLTPWRSFSLTAAWAGLRRTLGRVLGLLLLLTVPLVWYWAAGPEVYPVVNPESGGPTGASLLGSTLVVLLMLLLVPATLGERRPGIGRGWILGTWILYGAEGILYLSLDGSHVSHRNVAQILGLGSLVPWLLILPLYYRCYLRPRTARRWRGAALFWIGLLVLTGWLSFLPGVLDRLKFTNGLVAHSHIAMAGFITCFNAFVTSLLLRGTRMESVLGHRAAFWGWQLATFIYISSMWVSGWLESEDPSFTLIPNAGRDIIYTVRLICGLVMLSASVQWWIRGWRLPSQERMAIHTAGDMKPGLSDAQEEAAA